MESAEPIPFTLPPHLARHVVRQDYGAYTPRDHAVWRHILGRLTAHLKDKAHPSYLDGLAATGIGTERIPSLEEMNRKLARLGWRAVAVRGFIPPAVFTELQSLGVLAIASDIRSHEHVEYTPAPDIVHESAGHAPILADPTYAAYLKRCGVAGFKAIASRQDQDVFEAIRHLSVVKEDPAAGPEAARAAEARLQAALDGRTYVSESTRASRLYWWTAEFGLVGSLEHPRIYGAGLLSSIGEANRCLTAQVARLPLSLACVDQDFDITRMQPQLYVARDFGQLFEVLEEFEATLAWKRGGAYGLREALRAATVNHLLLDDGRELTGQLAAAAQADPGNGGPETLLAALSGPVMLSRGGTTGMDRPWPGPVLALLGPAAREIVRGQPGSPLALDLPGGLRLRGHWSEDGGVQGLAGSLRGEPLALPDAAPLVLAGGLPGVAGGPADPGAWDRWFGQAPAAGAREPDASLRPEAEQLAQRRKAEALPAQLAALYEEVARMRRAGRHDPARIEAIRAELVRYPGDWLLREELGELQARLAS